MSQLLDKQTETRPEPQEAFSPAAAFVSQPAQAPQVGEGVMATQALMGNAAVAASSPDLSKSPTTDPLQLQSTFGNAAVASSAGSDQFAAATLAPITAQPETAITATITDAQQTPVAPAETGTHVSPETAAVEQPHVASAAAPPVSEPPAVTTPASSGPPEAATVASAAAVGAPAAAPATAPAGVQGAASAETPAKKSEPAAQAAASEASTAAAAAKPAAGAPEKKEGAEKPGKAGAVTAGAQEGETAEQAAASPQTDPGFKAVAKRVGHAAAKQRAHAPAGAKSAEAQAAVKPPSNDISSRAAASHVGVMAEQKPKPFDRKAFMDALMTKIASATPESLEEADNFKDTGKLNEVKSGVTTQVQHGKDQAQGDIADRTKEPPSTKGIEAKPVTDLPPVDAGPAPGDVKASQAAPKPKTAAEVSLAEGSKEMDQQMEEGGITTEQLAKSNEPEFQGALDAKNEAQTDAIKAPQAYREEEKGLISKAQADAHSVAQADLKGMHGGRGKLFGKVHGVQGSAQTKEEQERTEVAAHIEGLFKETKEKVEARLAQLDHDVNDKFDKGASLAQGFFENYVETEMAIYKNDRYSGLGGGALWAKDKLFGMPDEVNEFYVRGRERYVQRMTDLLWEITGIVEQGLNEAHAEIENGKEKIRVYVDGLKGSVKKFGQKTAKEVQSKFDELAQTINDKQNQLIDSLAKKYQENLKKIDDRIEEMKAANRGLVDKALDAVVGVIKTILKLKDMLFDVLSRAAEAIGLIIQDPIGFLGNLVDGIGLGIRNFKDRIGEHLKQGLIDWLFGTMAEAGIQLPDSFDLKGILSLIMQILGLTYANIRARAVTILGEPIVKGLEEAAEIFKILITEGPAGVWEYVKEQIGDFKEMIMEQIKSFIIKEVIEAGIMWLISLLNPVAAFIKACKAIYEIVMFFVERINQIMMLVNAIIDSITAIAKGNISAAAAAVENALAKAIPVVLGFLAALLNISGITDTIKKIIEKIRAPINKAIDWVINKAVSMVKAAGKFLFGKKEPEKKEETKKTDDPEHDLKVEAGLAALDKEDKLIAENGKLSRKEAEQVAAKVKQNHPIFKSITVVSGGATWDYEYVASTGKKTGEKKEEGEHATNWDEVQKVLRKKIRVPLPEGYEYYERQDGDATRTFIRRQVANDKEFEPLTVDEEDIIQIGSEKSPRISKPGKLAKNLGGGVTDYEAHHLVPDAVVRRHPLTQAAISRGKPPYNLDEGSNGILLPATEEAKKLDPDNLPLHRGSHPDWNNYATRRLDAKLEILIVKHGAIETVPDPTLTKSVKDVEAELLVEIKTWKAMK